MAKIGFVGLGVMGSQMVSRLLSKGHSVTGYNRTRAKAEWLVDKGMTWADSPRAAASAADFIFAMVSNSAAIQAVADGPDGLLAGVHEGMVYFDLSTNSQAMVRRVNAALAEKKAFGFDAPVSGGPKGAETGKLAIWVGGDKAVYDKHKKVLDAIGDQAAYIGPIGSATVAKLVHNMAGYAIQTALAEVFTMGTKAGMDPLALWKAVRQGAQGRRRTFDGLARQFLVDKYTPPDFALKLAHKDVSLAVGLGRELGVPMRLCNLVLEEMNEARNRGWDTVDSRSPMKLQIERAGVSIKCDPAAVDAVLASDKA